MAILGEPGHCWITAQGPYEGNTAMLDIMVTRSGVFDSEESNPENNFDGIITAGFADCKGEQ